MLKSTCVRCSVGQKEIYGGQFQNEKLISLLIAVLMVFGLLPVLSAPATHASADSSDGYGDFKSASHPADTLRGFSYFYHDSKFMGGPYGWVSMASGNPEGASFISDFTESGYVAGEFYNGYVYGYRYAEESNYHFCKVNAFTFEETILGTSEAVAADMAYDYSTDTMYAVSGDLLCTVNLSDGSLTEVGFVGPDAMLALACSTDGQLYGIGDDCNLYAIEKPRAWAKYAALRASLRTDFNPWHGITIPTRSIGQAVQPLPTFYLLYNHGQSL